LSFWLFDNKTTDDIPPFQIAGSFGCCLSDQSNDHFLTFFTFLHFSGECIDQDEAGIETPHMPSLHSLDQDTTVIMSSDVDSIYAISDELAPVTLSIDRTSDNVHCQIPSTINHLNVNKSARFALKGKRGMLWPMGRLCRPCAHPVNLAACKNNSFFTVVCNNIAFHGSLYVLDPCVPISPFFNHTETSVPCTILNMMKSTPMIGLIEGKSFTDNILQCRDQLSAFPTFAVKTSSAKNSKHTGTCSLAHLNSHNGSCFFQNWHRCLCCLANCEKDVDGAGNELSECDKIGSRCLLHATSDLHMNCDLAQRNEVGIQHLSAAAQRMTTNGVWVLQAAGIKHQIFRIPPVLVYINRKEELKKHAREACAQQRRTVASEFMSNPTGRTDVLIAFDFGVQFHPSKRNFSFMTGESAGPKCSAFWSIF